jgi:hypothetical protein
MDGRPLGAKRRRPPYAHNLQIVGELVYLRPISYTRIYRIYLLFRGSSATSSSALDHSELTQFLNPPAREI